VRSPLLRAACCLAVLSSVALPLTADASSALRGVMRSWKRDLRASGPMVSGREAFDEATVRETLKAYIEESARLSASITGQSADAKDIRQRFVAFGADSRTALSNLGQPTTLKAAFARIGDDCQSCHDQYKD
jgi:cytochrome c556